MDSTLDHVFRDILPRQGAVDIVQHGETSYEQEERVEHIAPTGEKIKKRAKKKGLKDGSRAEYMRNYRKKNIDKVTKDNVRRKLQQRERRLKEKQDLLDSKTHKETLVKIPKVNLLARRASIVNRECGRTGATYAFTKTVKVVTHISYTHHGVEYPVLKADPPAAAPKIESSDVFALAAPAPAEDWQKSTGPVRCRPRRRPRALQYPARV